LKGAALIIPNGLLRALRTPSVQPAAEGFCEDPQARAQIERAAMEAVMAAERVLGTNPATYQPKKKAMTSRAAIHDTGISGSSRSKAATKRLGTLLSRKMKSLLR
jgi:hypothetical protein